MRCQRCGKEIGNSAKCTFCGYDNEESHVREMSNLEKNFYDGITIDAGENNEQNYSGSNSYNPKNNYSFSRSTIYISEESGFFSRLIGKLFNGLINNSRLAKIAVTLIVVALSVIMFFVAVPILFFLLAVGIALFIFSRLGR